MGILCSVWQEVLNEMVNICIQQDWVKEFLYRYEPVCLIIPISGEEVKKQ